MPSEMNLRASVLPSGTGFCAVSDELPLKENIDTDLTLASKSTGMCVALDTIVYCVAAEPYATFLRVDVMDGRHAIANEICLLGRLRRGYRVLQLRSLLGTRIELCYLFLHIEFRGEVTNLWPTPRQVGATARSICQAYCRRMPGDAFVAFI